MSPPSDAEADLDFGATLRGFSPGQRLFNRYTLKEVLGRGGMGIVWRACDEQLERDVALKFLPELVAFDEQAVKDLKRETKKSQELRHHHIIQVYDFLSDKQHACISMEYVDGPTLSALKARNNKGFFEIEEIRLWIQQLCEALSYAHETARVVHRDLKPANLMLNSKGDLKVADFGIARSLTESVSMLTMQRSTSGTLIYMSPQQLDGERATSVDDIYSLGASVYELLTSKPPFYSGQIDRQIRDKVPPSMTERRNQLDVRGERIDPVWEDMIARCLTKDPAKRPQSIREVATALVLWPSGTGSAKGETKIDEGSRKSTDVLSAVIGIAFVAAVGWFGFKAIQKWEQPKSTPAAAVQPAPSPVSTPTVAQPAFGSAIVRTAPSNATVTIDGKQMLSPATFSQLKPGTYPVRIDLSGYDSVEQQLEIKENQITELGTITLKQTKPVEAVATPAEPRPIKNAVYTGTIREKYASGYNVPVTISPAADSKSGTMTLSSTKGDLVVKYTGVWDGAVLRAVTNQIVSKPNNVTWEPEAFSLQFSNDGKSASYQCDADGKTYAADLSAAELGSTFAGKLSTVYKGAISGGTPLKITFGGDRRSGTITETSRTGDVVVRFSGIWDGATLRAVTNEVVSKPAKVGWTPESFTLRFAEDGRSASYECSADGKYYSAQLSSQ